MKVCTCLFVALLINTNNFCQNSKNQISFKVDAVKTASTFLIEEDLSKSLGRRFKREIKFIPPKYQHSKVVSTLNNSFIGTIQESYNNHRPLILSPDIIWLCITQGLSIHINQHFDKYRRVLFKDMSNEKIELLIREDSLSFQKDLWTKSINLISAKADKEMTKNCYNFFVPHFSTSDSITKTVMEITMLEALKQKFIYTVESGCGIPAITIKGTTQDWQWIYDNLQILNQFDLKDWAEELKPIIHQFINAGNNKVDVSFWKDIYKNAEEYNAHYISGWVIKLFPYIEQNESWDWNDTTKHYRWDDPVKILYKPNEYIYRNEYLKSTLSTDDFPSGISNIKLTWNNYFKHSTEDFDLFGGFLGIKQHKDKSLEPFVCWVLTNYSDTIFKPERDAYIGISNNKDYWSPNFARKVTDSAVLRNKSYNSATKSINYIKSLIRKQLEADNQFSDTSYKGKIVVIEILSNGTVGSVYAMDTTTYQNLQFFMEVCNYSNKLSIHIKSILNSIDEKWYPALAHPVDVLEIPDAPANLSKIKVKVNSFVKITL